MSSAAVRKLISLAAELSEDERRVVVDAIAPKESIASLAEQWESEIARRAERVRSGHAPGKPADDVFDRLESKAQGPMTGSLYIEPEAEAELEQRPIDTRKASRVSVWISSPKCESERGTYSTPHIAFLRTEAWRASSAHMPLADFPIS